MSIFQIFKKSRQTLIPHYIAIEGIDGSGKSSVMEELQKLSLAECDNKIVYNKIVSNKIVSNVILLPNPNGYDYIRIRELLKKDNLSKYETIELCLRMLSDMSSFSNHSTCKNQFCLTDRSLLSTYVYQQETIKKYNLKKLIHQFAFPSIIIYLKVPPKLAIERIDSRSSTRELFETEEYLTKLHKRYEDNMWRIKKNSKGKLKIYCFDTDIYTPKEIAKIVYFNFIKDNDEILSEDKLVKFKCGVCDQTFSSQRKANIHYSNEH